MTADQRRRALLTGALVLLAAFAFWQFSGPGTTAGLPAASGTAAAAGGAQRAPADVLAEGVGLERLSEDRPAPAQGGRDPFRTGATENGEARGPGGPPPPVLVPVVPAPGPVGPPGPPPLPPIPVKFIGFVSRQDVGRVAVLSDGRNVYYGRAGEIVDGRWRIVSIGEESLQIEYADGRGRLTLRLTG